MRCPNANLLNPFPMIALAIMNHRRRRALVCLTAFMAITTCAFRAGAITLDWNQVTWTAGSLSQSFDIDAENAGNDITIAISGNGTGDFSANYPAATTDITGGQGVTQKSLDLYMDQFKNANKFVTITITFNYSTGVRDIDFLLFDVDSGAGWTDQIRNIQGSFGTTNYAATISGSANNSVTGTGLNQLVTGTASTAASSADANVALAFGGNYLTEVSFDYGNAPGTVVNSIQYIGLYDIHYRTKVPEVNPAWGALMVCALALGIRAWRDPSDLL
jgi:hypothetical protein